MNAGNRGMHNRSSGGQLDRQRQLRVGFIGGPDLTSLYKWWQAKAG